MMIANILGLCGVTGAKRDQFSPSARADLRYGGQDITAHLAYPHLARYWRDTSNLELPIRWYAALVANNHRVHHVPGKNVGTAMRHSNLRFKAVEQRLLILQNMPLSAAGSLIEDLISSCQAGVDWHKVWDLYRWWDHNDPDIQRQHRRSLLAEFYQADDDITDPDSDVADVTAPAAN